MESVIDRRLRYGLVRLEYGYAVVEKSMTFFFLLNIILSEYKIMKFIKIYDTSVIRNRKW